MNALQIFGLEWSTISSNPLIVLGALAFLIIALLGRHLPEILRTRVELAQLKRKAEFASAQREKYRAQEPERPGKLDNFEILERYYEQTLAENKMLSRSAIGISIVGFIVILSGVGLAFSGFVSVGLVSSIGGLVAEAATVMFFNQLKEQVRQVKEYHSKLVSAQYIMTAISLTERLSDAEKETQLKQVIQNLLFLTNELHGSSSTHLFNSSNDGVVPLRVAS